MGLQLLSWHNVFCRDGPSWLHCWAFHPSSLCFQLNTFLLLASSSSCCLSFGLQPPRFPLPKMLIFVLAGSLWTYYIYVQNMALASGANYPICVRWWPWEMWCLMQQYLSVRALVSQHTGDKWCAAFGAAHGEDCEQWPVGCPGARNVVLCSSCILSLCCDLQAGWVGVAVALLEEAPCVGLPHGQGWAGGLLHGISTEVIGIAWMQGWELVVPFTGFLEFRHKWHVNLVVGMHWGDYGPGCRFPQDFRWVQLTEK